MSEHSVLNLELYRGTSFIRNSPPPPPKNHRRTLGIVLLKGPRRGVFLMSEVPLQGVGCKVQWKGCSTRTHKPALLVSQTQVAGLSHCHAHSLALSPLI